MEVEEGGRVCDVSRRWRVGEGKEGERGRGCFRLVRLARAFVMCYLAGEVKANARVAMYSLRRPVKVEYHKLTKHKRK